MLTKAFPHDVYYSTNLGWDQKKRTIPELATILAWRMNYPVDNTNGEMTKYVSSIGTGYVRVPVNESDPQHVRFKNNILFCFVMKGTPLQEAIVKIFTKTESGGAGYTHVRYNPDGTTEIDKLEFSLDNSFSTTKTIKQLVIEKGNGTLAVSGETGDGSIADLSNNIFGEDSADTAKNKFATINSFLYENPAYEYLIPRADLEQKINDSYMVLYDKDTKYIKGENLLYFKTDEFIEHDGSNTHKILIFDEVKGVTLAKQKDIEIGTDDNILVYTYRSSSVNDEEDIMGLGSNLLSNDNGYLITKPGMQVGIKFDGLDDVLGDMGGIFNRAINNSQVEVKTPVNEGRYAVFASILTYSDRTKYFPFDVTFRMIHKHGVTGDEKVLSIQKVVFDKVMWERVFLSGIMTMDLNDVIFITFQSSMGAGGVYIMKDFPGEERTSTWISYKLSSL